MMKFDKTSLCFSNSEFVFSSCLLQVQLFKKWLEAVQDEHKQKLCVI